MNGNPSRTPTRTAAANGVRRSGFTILELIAVIGIIAVLATIVFGGFSGMLQSMARRNASDGLRRAVLLARQEACVRGADTYLFLVDVNKYVLVTKAGVVTAKTTGTDQPSYYSKPVQGNWVVDAYADLASAAQTFTVDTTDSQNQDVFKNYESGTVYDMTEGVSAVINWPPWSDKATGQWKFGVKDFGGGFKAGNVYGWVSHPVQQLPDGYVFEGSYNGKGEFSRSEADKIQVHFLPDGQAEKPVTFKLLNAATDERVEIEVDKAGKVSEK